MQAETEMLRAVRNQSLYREVNERMESLNRAFEELVDAGSSWVCECADTDCTVQLTVPLAEYEELRTHPDRFAVFPGHVYPEVERVVVQREGYVVVAKLGVGAEFAVEHDPRSEAVGGSRD